METKIGTKDMVDTMLRAGKFPPRAVSQSMNSRWFPKDKKLENGEQEKLLKLFAQDPFRKNKSGVVISGKMSSGKTIALGLIARLILGVRAKKYIMQYEEGGEPDVPVYYLPPSVASIIFNEVRDNTAKRAYYGLMNIEFLFMDDVDKLLLSFLSNRGLAMLESLLSERIEFKRPTFLTSGTPIDKLDVGESMMKMLANAFHQIEIRSCFPEECDE